MNTHKQTAEAGHEAMQELLPWYAAGSLQEAEAAGVQEHLRGCAACREDLAWQRKLLETGPAMPAGLDAERALARLMPQVDTADSQTTVPAVAAGAALPAASAASVAAAGRGQPARQAQPGAGARLLGWLRGQGGWQGWAIAAQFAVIAGLALIALPRNEPPAYQALGRGQAAEPDVLVVFKPEARVQDMQQLLQSSGAHIVGGPTVTGAYMLDVDPARQAALLAALRANAAVELAEPLSAGSTP